MPFRSPSIRDDRQPLALTSAVIETDRVDRWLEGTTWAFVSLGVLLRVARYLMDYPLWWDEAFVAVNFIRRDYIDLLRPLDYGQVCPILFLWCELALVKLLGFSEWSLRLFPLSVRSPASSSSGMWRVASCGDFPCSWRWRSSRRRSTRSFTPLTSSLTPRTCSPHLILLAIAVEWSRAPERARWMWAMAAMAPIAWHFHTRRSLSPPESWLGLAPAVMNARRRGVWIAYAAFALSTVAAFLALYLVFTRAQAAANLTAMQTQWVAAFPPLRRPACARQMARDCPHRQHVRLSLWRRERSEQSDFFALCRRGRRAVVPGPESNRADLPGSHSGWPSRPRQ